MEKTRIALDVIQGEIAGICPEYSDSEPAMEWAAHLRDVAKALQNGKMTVAEAESDLGISLAKPDRWEY